MTNEPQDRTRLQAALDGLTDALENHLEACLGRSGEADHAVQATYTALRHAAQQYDDLLFELRDEVTPWEFPDGPHVDIEYEDADAEPSAVGVFVRRDYDIADTDELLGAGREAYGELYPTDPLEAAIADVSHPGRALYQLLHAYGVDGLDQRAEGAGLTPRGGTVWVQELAEGDPDTLVGEPFDVVDEELLIYRLDEVMESGTTEE
ncbi:hypothetical protein EF847_13050 [Actinobacteria bacterium YIM 96077]|uniref:Uncharacterized protein n=1 Tax=Phytoactinopolyspora halophila TaxID=1981511 RepID=A0A329QEG8_9ACTN|nr:hypothetical protein [Phytoactinopolyspora halophila]AYY13480.1 hypothetical protein EF847_13050 [Actinobacteria bacterium YIM 96077]RAW10873.1 hypothetical protein DPM12_18430 [Phytoactinopolyspora halophila]